MENVQSVLDKRWKNACKVVLKGEVGPLEQFLPYLSELVDPLSVEKSAVSGKQVSFAFDDYAKGSRRISLDEVKFDQKFSPLSINEIKDIDSILEAIDERIGYCGNVILGNSAHVEKSCNLTDCHYAYQLANIGNSKYLACCGFGRLNEDCYGTYGPGESTFCIRCSQTYRENRCFEVWNSQNITDSYYCYGMSGCSDCIFSFNQRNKRRCVGNLQLDATSYEKIKEKLLLEIREELKRKKRAPSLIEMLEKSRKVKPIGLDAAIDIEKYEGDSGIVSREFAKTCSLLLHAKTSHIDDYHEWLKRHADPVQKRKSCASGKHIYTVRHMIAVKDMPSDRLLTNGEALMHGEKNALSMDEATSIGLSNAHQFIGKIGFLAVDFREGNNPNVPHCTTCIDSSNCYEMSGPVYSKNCGYTFWARNSENCFGCHSVFDSSFLINCYRSQKLSRCFECDTCRDCSDAYFCHNCENVRDSMFCFNAKNLSYAIGNAPLPAEEYRKVKAMLLEQIGNELGKKKGLKWDIFSVGSKQ